MTYKRSNCTLTSGTDTGAAFTGGAGNDTFNATATTLNALDSIDGGAGTNTLTIYDSASIATQPATVANIQTLNVTSTAGTVGAVAADAALATKQQVTYTFSSTQGTSVGAGPVKITYGGASQTIANSTIGNAVTIRAITASINALAGATVATDDTANASDTTGSITITSPTAGVALPAVAFENGTMTAQGSSTATTNSTIDVTPATNYSFPITVMANQVASAAVTASTFTVPTGVTTATISAAASAGVASVSTAATTVSGTAVTLSGGASQTVTASDSVKATGSTGPVSVTVSAAPATSIAASSSGGWAAGAGVYVTGGTTVSISEAVGTASSGSISASNAKAVQVGNLPSASTSGSAGANTGARTSSTVDGYPEVVGNKSTAPTGDVTVSVKSAYTNAAGLASVKYGTGDVKIYMNGGTTASVTGAASATIQDINTTLLKSSLAATAVPGTSKLTTVNLQGLTGNVGISSDAITTLSVVDTSSSTVTINSNTGANSGALNLSIGNSTATVSASNATSVAVTGVAGAYAAITSTKNPTKNDSDLTLSAPKATSVSFGGSSKITLNSGSTLTKMTTITANGSSDLVLGTVTSFGKLTSVDASGATGTVTATIDDTIAGTAATDYGFSIKTGSGKDTVTIAGNMTSGTDANGAVIQNTISLGAGDDKLLFLASSNGAIGTGATADGGDGVDLVSSNLLNAGNATRITNFEVLGLAETSGTYDATLLVGATGVQALATGATYSGVKTSQGLTYANASGATGWSSGTTTLTFPTAATTATDDSYTVTFAGTAASSATATSKTSIPGYTLSIDKIEAVNIVSGGTGFVANSLTLKDAEARTVTITGAQDITLTAGVSGTNLGTAGDATNGKGVSLIDASALTGNFTLVTNAYIEVPYNGVSTVKGGSGNDDITVALTKTVVDAGAGNDKITVAAAVSTTLTGGSGKDTFVLTSATANSTTAGSTVITTITDYDRANDTIQIGDADPFVKFVPTSGNSFQDVLTAALNGSAGGAAANSAVWFTYGGDTYIAKQDGTSTFGTGDIIVKLTGIVDLSSAATDNASSTTGLVGTA